MPDPDHPHRRRPQHQRLRPADNTVRLWAPIRTGSGTSVALGTYESIHLSSAGPDLSVRRRSLIIACESGIVVIEL